MWELSEGRVWDEAEVDEKKQGCPACCGREQGWAWETGEDGSRAWRHRGGERRVEATAQHMICGQCTGMGPRGERKKEMVDALRAVNRAMHAAPRKDRKTKKGGRVQRGGASPMVAAYAQARGMVAVAVKAAMSDVWGGREAEALRGVLAGDLPVDGGGNAATQTKPVTTKQVCSCESSAHAKAVGEIATRTPCFSPP